MCFFPVPDERRIRKKRRFFRDSLMGKEACEKEMKNKYLRNPSCEYADI